LPGEMTPSITLVLIRVIAIGQRHARVKTSTLEALVEV